jgi:cytochrome b
MTTRILIWDLPTRLFHWLLAGSFLSAFTIAVSTDDEGRLFPVHVLLGLVAAFLLALRLVWGVVGSRTSRFSALALRPSELWSYVRELRHRGVARFWPGHNPAASWVTIVMFGSIAGLAGTGILLSNGVEAVEEIHAALAWTMIGAVGIHLAGLALHTLRNREPIAGSMIDGRRLGLARGAIASSRPWAGLLFLALTGAWTGGLVRSYDPATSSVTVPVLGAHLTLGESGEGAEDDDD